MIAAYRKHLTADERSEIEHLDKELRLVRKRSAELSRMRRAIVRRVHLRMWRDARRASR